VIRSMTGYGEAARVLENGVLRVGMKTVNHRFLNVTARTPPAFERIEQELQAWLRPHILRGHVQLAVSFETGLTPREQPLPELDLERARRYAELLRRLRDELGLGGEPDLSAIARFGDVFRGPDPSASNVRLQPTVDAAVVRELVEEAARAVVSMREAEGARLSADMSERLRVLSDETERIADRAPTRLQRERERLRTAIRELTEQDDVDEDRLAREVAYLAERWDLNEEVVRFRSHLDLFRDTLLLEAAEGVGKRLGFVVQEMHREVNTMGAKANDVEIARATVTMKEEIERLREQVENVE